MVVIPTWDTTADTAVHATTSLKGAHTVHPQFLTHRVGACKTHRDSTIAGLDLVGCL